MSDSSLYLMYLSYRREDLRHLNGVEQVLWQNIVWRNSGTFVQPLSRGDAR